MVADERAVLGSCPRFSRDEPRRQARDVSFERRFKSQGQQFEDLERSGFLPFFAASDQGEFRLTRRVWNPKRNALSLVSLVRAASSEQEPVAVLEGHHQNPLKLHTYRPRLRHFEAAVSPPCHGMSWCRSISQLRREVAERTDAIESTLPKFDVGRNGANFGHGLVSAAL